MALKTPQKGPKNQLGQQSIDTNKAPIFVWHCWRLFHYFCYFLSWASSSRKSPFAKYVPNHFFQSPNQSEIDSLKKRTAGHLKIPHVLDLFFRWCFLFTDCIIPWDSSPWSRPPFTGEDFWFTLSKHQTSKSKNIRIYFLFYPNLSLVTRFFSRKSHPPKCLGIQGSAFSGLRF